MYIIIVEWNQLDDKQFLSRLEVVVYQESSGQFIVNP